MLRPLRDDAFAHVLVAARVAKRCDKFLPAYIGVLRRAFAAEAGVT